MQWKLYYDDGTTFSDEDGTWGDAPARGVQAIGRSDKDHGRYTGTGDYYVYWRYGPIAMDIAGLWDYLIEINSPEAHKRLSDVNFDALTEQVKFGRFIGHDEFMQIKIRADSDPDFPPRTGYRAFERQ